MDLDCFPTVSRPPQIVPGRPQRAWMESFLGRHPYRCLPLTIANSTGWELLCPMAFTAEWNGGVNQEDIRLTPDRPHPEFHDFVKSHFSHGVMTMHPGYLFRTPAGWDLIAQGPPNWPKDGLSPLTGLVETDWLPFPFTMNWIFTRPGKVRFEKDEPFCFISLTPHRVMDTVQPVQRAIANNVELNEQYLAWNRQRETFNTRIWRRDPEAVREAWQRFYFRGELPEDAQGGGPVDHVNKRRLKPLKLGR